MYPGKKVVGVMPAYHGGSSGERTPAEVLGADYGVRIILGEEVTLGPVRGGDDPAATLLLERLEELALPPCIRPVGLELIRARVSSLDTRDASGGWRPSWTSPLDPSRRSSESRTTDLTVFPHTE